MKLAARVMVEKNILIWRTGSNHGPPERKEISYDLYETYSL
jgi:hypothetical protein